MENERTAGIIAEYNPFHNGHKHMIDTLRGRGYASVLCVVSGPFVQRAEPALFPVQLRAKAALAAGADLVVRLPVGWAAASAEGFGRGGVALLAGAGCVGAVAFGAECPDAALLTQVARLFDLPAYPPLLRAGLQNGLSFAAARADAAEQLLPGAGALLARPNNILAVEYCKAILRLKREGRPAPTPLALPREGVDHDGGANGAFASASHLRRLFWQQGPGGWAQYVPPACMGLYEEAAKEGRAIDPARWETAALSRLRGRAGADFAALAPGDDGLARRMEKALARATSLEELYALAKTKRFAHSGVRRLALWGALGLAPAGPAEAPPFLHVLGANERGLALLARMKSAARLPVSASLAALSRAGGAAAGAARAEAACEDLYALCQAVPGPCGGAFRTPAAFPAKRG